MTIYFGARRLFPITRAPLHVALGTACILAFVSPVRTVKAEADMPSAPATCELPGPIRGIGKLEPLHLEFAGTFATPGGSTPITSSITVSPHTLGGWAVTERAVLPHGIAVDSARLDVASLAPRERVTRQGAVTIALQVMDTVVAETITTKDSTRTLNVSHCGALFADGAGSFLVIGRLPLRPNYRISLSHLDLRSATVSSRSLEVVGTERVVVPAGTYETWKVELRDTGAAVPTTVWIDIVSRIPVQFSSSQGPITVKQQLERTHPE